MKVALITGVRRIGKEIAKALIDKGYSLSVVYRFSRNAVDELIEYAKDKNIKVKALQADLCDYGSYEKLVKETYEEFGRIDAFVHLASPYERKGITKTTREDLYYHFIPIAEAFFFISIECYKLMLRNEDNVKGRIVAFGDWATNISPYRGFGSYFVAKGALHTAVKVLAKEFAPHVLVNCVAPGPVMKAENYSEEEWKKILSRTPLRREVSIKDVVNTTHLLLETESITGEIICVDGGRHIAGSGV